tara:strand:+ start:239 stop:490 length:252 start_codon:yes stop_codon:yes gene_type:complete
MGEEESKVEQTISPSIDLSLSNSWPVRNTDFCGILLTEVTASTNLEFLRKRHSIVARPDSFVLENRLTEYPHSALRIVDSIPI